MGTSEEGASAPWEDTCQSAADEGKRGSGPEPVHSSAEAAPVSSIQQGHGHTYHSYFAAGERNDLYQVTHPETVACGPKQLRLDHRV